MNNKLSTLFATGVSLIFANTGVLAHTSHNCPEWLPDAPAITGHLEQDEIINGQITTDDVIEAGRQLFNAQFNTCDGQGRPATTGGGAKRAADQPEFIRTSAPESNSCAGCHSQPFSGGAGDFVANVFVLAQTLDPVTESVSSEFSNERNTLGMFGSGAIELLGREMTADLQSQAAVLGDGDHVLTTKGVEFEVTILGGSVVASRGVDTDLVVKPFHQAGVVRSLREFTVNAFNHHHGMQAEERFDLNPDKNFEVDFDEDGVEREITIGDTTATTIYQAALPIPVRVMPEDPSERLAVNNGEELFETVGCTSCHTPTLKLNDTVFVEPYNLNPAGTFSDVSQAFSFDLATEAQAPRLRKMADGGANVKAYTDLKRHNLCDDEADIDPIRFLCNETLAQARPDQDGRPGREFFITRKLWDVGNSAPYGHRGDLTTIGEAILVHGGEGRASRDAYVSLSSEEQANIIKFLKTLQVVQSTDNSEPNPRNHNNSHRNHNDGHRQANRRNFN